MKTGHGSVKIRGQYKVEKNALVFYEIPYGTNIEALVAELGVIANNKEIEGISDIRDESNKRGLRLVIECEKGINPESIVNKVFSKTNLQTSFSYNQVGLIDKTPTELNLKDCIKIYVEHNIDCLIKECNFDLTKAQDRLHIVEGLLKALEDIDNIIALIKASKDAGTAKVTLMDKYSFSEPQAKAILAMRLSSLAKLESVELNDEKKDLVSKIETLNNILANKDVQLETIIERLDKFVQKFGDDRRTTLEQIEIPKEEKDIVEVVPEDVVVVVMRNGDVKRIPRASFKTQRRKGKGIKTMDESILASISTNTIDTLMVFTSKGRMFRLLVDKVPVGTNASRGGALRSILKMDPDEEVVAVTSLYRKTNAEYVVFFTKQGLIKKTPLKDYMETKKTTGLQAIKFKEGDELVNVTFLKDESVMVITNKGYSIYFDTDNINPVGRVASGVKAVKLSDGDYVIAGLPVKEDENLAVFDYSGIGKMTPVNSYTKQARGGKGVLTSKKDCNLVGAAIVDENDEVLLIGSPSSICISAKDIPVMSRIGGGNMMISGSNIIRVVKL